MIVIGELINSTRKVINQAIESKDKEYLQDIAKRQMEAGARIIDVNTAASGDEVENMKWLVEIVQEVVSLPLCIDSPNPKAIEAGLALCKQRAVVNSISGESQRYAEIIPLVKEYKAQVIALCMEDGGMPETVEDRLRIAEKLVADLLRDGLAEADIFLDPLIKPLGVNHFFGVQGMEATSQLRQHFPKVHIVSGLSNISFGLPERKLLNRAYMTMCAAMGMDSFIMDPLDQPLMSLLAAAKALNGQDAYCMEYIKGVRSQKIKA